MFVKYYRNSYDLRGNKINSYREGDIDQSKEMYTDDRNCEIWRELTLDQSPQ